MISLNYPFSILKQTRRPGPDILRKILQSDRLVGPRILNLYFLEVEWISKTDKIAIGIVISCIQDFGRETPQQNNFNNRSTKTAATTTKYKQVSHSD